MENNLQESSHRTVVGRVAIVDRIKGGKVQIRHIVNETAGYKIVDGQLVKMTPEEMRARKRGARIAVRKRRAEEAQIDRNLHTSLRKREVRLG